MDERFKYLLSPLLAERDDKNEIRVVLIDYEHFDYISDVLAEHFDIIGDGAVTDDENERYILYFSENLWDELSSAIDKINSYHKEQNKVFGTI